MGLLLKFAIAAVVGYMVWSAISRTLGGVLGGNRRPAEPPPRQPQAARPAVEETKLCPTCGTYVSLSAGKCGRSDCPLPA
jgi:hypothetical protein